MRLRSQCSSMRDDAMVTALSAEKTSRLVDQALEECSRGSFTGLLQVHTRQGNAQLRFLSGIQDGAVFGGEEGDQALASLHEASDPVFEAVACLPSLTASENDPLPLKGSLGDVHAARLMRFCEEYSLTCALELESDGQTLTANYRLGELLSLSPDSAETARVAEAHHGRYRFRLPRFELTSRVPRPQRELAVSPAAPRAAAPSSTSGGGVAAVARSGGAPASPRRAAPPPRPNMAVRDGKPPATPQPSSPALREIMGEAARLGETVQPLTRATPLDGGVAASSPPAELSPLSPPREAPSASQPREAPSQASAWPEPEAAAHDSALPMTAPYPPEAGRKRRHVGLVVVLGMATLLLLAFVLSR